MWARIASFFASKVLEPLVEKGFKALINWIKSSSEEKKANKLKKKKTNLITKISKARTNEERKELSIALDKLNNN